MFKKIFVLFAVFAAYTCAAHAQTIAGEGEGDAVPVVSYDGQPRQFAIANMTVTGAEAFDSRLLINYSGLQIGQTVMVPGDEIADAVKRFWKQGMFSDVRIEASKIEGDSIWLNFALMQRPKVAEVTITGVKKSDKEDISKAIPLRKGSMISPNLLDRTKTIIANNFEERGYKNVEINITQAPDLTEKNAMAVNIDINRNAKVKVNDLIIEGNEVLSQHGVDKAMKKTNERGKWYNLLKSKKFTETNFEADKDLLIDRYNELGHRDAAILSDSIADTGKNRVNVYLNLYEGQRYYIRNIRWIGNTVHSTELLNRVLGFAKGDVYNQRRLQDRLMNDQDAVANLYLDNGYLFFHIDPVETNIVGDSVDLEMRMFEGRQATIDRIGIVGNERVYENVIRRELRTKPGELFSKADVIRTVRELAQMGHFNPETINPDIKPNADNGTVDINYKLETKGSDQVELSGGYGPTGVIVSGSLKFTNFAIQNIFKPSTYRIVPQGEGQTLMLRAQTNGSYYQSYSISFLEPWLGGRRPNSLSASIFFSRQTGMSDSYYTNYWSQTGGTLMPNDYDTGKHINILGASVGLGKRLSWPDDYFTLYNEISYQRFDMKNWSYFIMQNGVANNLSYKVTFGRNSIDNPIYTRSGSQINLSLQITPPYSLFSNKDFGALTEIENDANATQEERNAASAQKYKWIEYHKWKFKARMFTPLTGNGNLVLMGRIEYGFLGYFDRNRRSPFETFYMGGDGMTGASSAYATESVGMRGYSNGVLTATNLSGVQMANYYSRLGLELRYPLTLSQTTTIYGLAFVDAGNSWYDLKDFSPFDLKRSAGVGMRIFLPMIGMLGLDWGYGFDKVRNGNVYEKSGSQFTFVIGQEF